MTGAAVGPATPTAGACGPWAASPCRISPLGSLRLSALEETGGSPPGSHMSRLGLA